MNRMKLLVDAIFLTSMLNFWGTPKTSSWSNKNLLLLLFPQTYIAALLSRNTEKSFPHAMSTTSLSNLTLNGISMLLFTLPSSMFNLSSKSVWTSLPHCPYLLSPMVYTQPYTSRNTKCDSLKHTLAMSCLFMILQGSKTISALVNDLKTLLVPLMKSCFLLLT